MKLLLLLFSVLFAIALIVFLGLWLVNWLFEDREEQERRRRWFGAPVALLMAVSLGSCTVVNGNRTTGAYTYATVGGDARGIAQTPDGYTAEALTTSDSFREGTKALRWALVAAATQGIASDLSGAWRSVAKAKEATKATTIRSAADVQKAGIAADVQKTALSSEAATAAP